MAAKVSDGARKLINIYPLQAAIHRVAGLAVRRLDMQTNSELTVFNSLLVRHTRYGQTVLVHFSTVHDCETAKRFFADFTYASGRFDAEKTGEHSGDVSF